MATIGSHGTAKSGCVLCRLDSTPNSELGDALRPPEWDPTGDETELDGWDEEVEANLLVFRGHNGDAAVLANLGIEGTETLETMSREWDLPMEMVASFLVRRALAEASKSMPTKPDDDELLRTIGDMFVHRGDAYDFGDGAVWPDRDEEDS